MQLVIGSKCHYEKNRCADLIVGGDILIGIICPAFHIAFPFHVFVNLLIFVQTLLPSFSCTLPLMQTLSLSLHYLALFPLRYILHKNPWQTFLCYH